MKRNTKYSRVFGALTGFCFLFNIIGIIIFKNHVKWSINTFVAASIFILLLIQGILAYSQKDNRLFFAGKHYTGRFYRYNRPTQRQLKDFYVKATVYFAILPFYLPLAVFSSKEVHSLWILLLLFIHIFAIASIDIRKMMMERKEWKNKETILEKEKEEQEKLEELGYWKK